jgi:hypothetical protein
MIVGRRSITRRGSGSGNSCGRDQLRKADPAPVVPKATTAQETGRPANRSAARRQSVQSQIDLSFLLIASWVGLGCGKNSDGRSGRYCRHKSARKKVETGKIHETMISERARRRSTTSRMLSPLHSASRQGRDTDDQERSCGERSAYPMLPAGRPAAKRLSQTSAVQRWA